MVKKSRYRRKVKGSDEAQIDEVIKSLRICSQCSSCANCMFKTMRDEYEQEFGGPEFTCRSALMDAASELLCYFTDVREEKAKDGQVRA